MTSNRRDRAACLHRGRRKVVAALAAAVTSVALIAARPEPPASPPPIVVPLHVGHTSSGSLRLGIDVTIGGRTSRVLLDSGSSGLRILAAAVPDGAARRTGRPARATYVNGLVAEGEEALAQVSIGTAPPSEIAFEIVDQTHCVPGAPSCASFATINQVFTMYAGVLGIASISRTDRCCANPLLALSDGIGRRFIVHSDIAGPTLTLNPDAAALRGFTMVDVPLGTRPTACIHVSGSVPKHTCGPLAFDTGSTMTLILGSDVADGSVEGGTATLSIGEWSHVLQAAPRSPAAMLGHTAANFILVGLPSMQTFDVYFDLEHGRMGMSSAPPVPSS